MGKLLNSRSGYLSAYVGLSNTSKSSMSKNIEGEDFVVRGYLSKEMYHETLSRTENY